MDFHSLRFPSRSNVLAHRGMVATSQPLAVQEGLAVLRSGGNAVDAAIATAAMLCVVEPCSTGIGGDAFALIWWANDRRLYGLNASGPAGAQVTADFVRVQGYQHMPERGGLTVTVPGSLRGWEMVLERFGTQGLDSLLAPAIRCARDGFPVSQQIALAWSKATDLLEKHPVSSRVWLPGGRAPGPGQMFYNPELARTFERLADQGCNAFYSGEIGRQLVNAVQEGGGLLSLDDLAAYRAEWIEPLQTMYRYGHVIHELPPNGQGLAALLAFNIAREVELAPGSVDTWHYLIEAVKLAFADAAAYVSDPRFVETPISGLLDPAYAQSRRQLINPNTALEPFPGKPAAKGDTVYISVVDGQGNMVSWIQSLYMGFGSGLTAGTTGVQLHNRGANFNLEPGHPNELGPGKRPYHTIIPGFITRHGQPWCSFGVMGGFMQPQGHLQVGTNLIDFNMDPQSALDAPRFRWLGGRRIALEAAVPDNIYRGLAARGHDLLSRQDAERVFYGGGQIVIRDPDSGVLIGGSDFRRDGAAAGW